MKSKAERHLRENYFRQMGTGQANGRVTSHPRLSRTGRSMVFSGHRVFNAKSKEVLNEHGGVAHIMYDHTS